MVCKFVCLLHPSDANKPLRVVSVRRQESDRQIRGRRRRFVGRHCNLQYSLEVRETDCCHSLVLFQVSGVVMGCTAVVYIIPSVTVCMALVWDMDLTPIKKI